MKYARYALIVVLLLILAFFGIGLVAPTISYTNEVNINKPVEDTFTVFCDSSKLSSWVPNFKSIELIRGRHNYIGTRYKMVVVDDGEEYELIETITDYQENVLFSMSYENDVLTTDVQVTFEESDGATQLTAHNLVRGKGMFMRSALVLMQNHLFNQSQIGYQNFKRLVEDD